MSKSSKAPLLRLAFIGAGGIADAHLAALANMPDVQVVALADVYHPNALARAEKWGVDPKACFSDYQEMLDKIKPDAVDVVTPNGVHAPASIAALQAGAHVIVEKPMAMNADECRAMIAAAKAADRKLVIAFQYRYDPRTQFLKQAADEGQFGDIMFARVQALRRRGIPNWGVFGQRELQGGGPMIDIGVHMLEQCHYVMGHPRPVSAMGMTRTYMGDKPSSVVSMWPNWDHQTYNVEDIAVGHVRFENGAVMHIESSFVAHIKQGVMDFQLMGTRGGCTWHEPQIFTDQANHMVDIAPHWLPKTDNALLFQRKLRNFVEHVLYDKPTMAPAEHGLMVQQMIDTIYRSAHAGGKETSVKELAP